MLCGIFTESSDYFCPDNMIFGNCTCQNTCEDPDGRNGCYGTCGEIEMCFCPEGFFIKEERCVPAEECDCFQPGDGVIPVRA